MKYPLLSIILIYCVILTGCNGNSNYLNSLKAENSSLRDSIEHLNSRIAELQNQQNIIEPTITDAEDDNQVSQNDDVTGNYQFTDESGRTFLITLNSDESFVITNTKTDEKWYGTWTAPSEKYDFIALGCRLSDSPYITYPKGSREFYMQAIKDDYLYDSAKDLKSHNPKARLHIDKL